jgi:carbamoyl-phosphate synthase large subunit
MIRQSRRLIVGAAGSANSFGTIQSVRERYGKGIFIVAIDPSRRELVASSVLADAFVQVPLARAPEFPAALRDIAAGYPASAYLPVHDDEIEVAARLAAGGSLPSGLELIAPPYDVVRRCNDKWAMHQWLAQHDLPSPETAPATPAALGRMGRAAILKPREGSGGDNFRRVHKPSDLADVDSTRWLIQEALREPEIGIDVFLGRDGQAFRCVCREYLEKRATVATKVRVHEDRALASIAERLARTLPLFGAFLVQAMRDATGQWRITDVNPRVGSGTRMCVPLGLDFAAANLADYWGERTEPLLRPLDGEHYVVRQFADYVTGRSRPAPARA